MNETIELKASDLLLLIRILNYIRYGRTDLDETKVFSALQRIGINIYGVGLQDPYTSGWYEERKGEIRGIERVLKTFPQKILKRHTLDLGYLFHNPIHVSPSVKKIANAIATGKIREEMLLFEVSTATTA